MHSVLDGAGAQTIAQIALHMCRRADVDETSKAEIKQTLQQYDRTLLVSDPRRCEPKKCVPDTDCCMLYVFICAL